MQTEGNVADLSGSTELLALYLRLRVSLKSSPRADLGIGDSGRTLSFPPRLSGI